MKAKIKKTSEIVDVYYEQQNMHPDYVVYKESVLVNGRTFTEDELELCQTTRHEEIERASVEYQMQKNPMAIGGDMFDDMIYRMNINPSFIAGAEWADTHPINFNDDSVIETVMRTCWETAEKEKLKEVIGWLKAHINDYLVHGRDIDLMFDDLKNAMAQ